MTGVGRRRRRFVARLRRVFLRCVIAKLGNLAGGGGGGGAALRRPLVLPLLPPLRD